MKKRVVMAAAALLTLVGATAAAADNNTSACGATHGAFANVNGNFGFLGEVGGTPGLNHAVPRRAATSRMSPNAVRVMHR